MSTDLKLIVSHLDDLADSFEHEGDVVKSILLDKVANLLVLAEKEVSTEVSAFAEILSKYLDVEPEDSLILASNLIEKYGSKVESEAEEKEGDISGLLNSFPVGALPQKERRQGPDPKDISIGTPEFWKNNC